MSRIRLYIDEDAIAQSFIDALRLREVDVVTVAEARMLHKTDEEQLSWATEKGRVLFSFNIGDFYRLHTERLQQGSSHAGIILSKQQRYGVGDQVRGVLRLISARSAEEMVGKVEFLSSWIMR